MKGISSLVTMLILLAISITLASLSFGVFSSIFKVSVKETEEQFQQQATQFSVNFKIENVEGDKVYIRNIGTSNLSGLTFYVNNINVNAIGDSIEPGKVGIFI